MRESLYSNSKDYINRWIISYADLVTLLLALFIVMYAINNADLKTKLNLKSSTLISDIKKEKVVNMPDLQKELLKEFKNNKDILLLKDYRGLIVRFHDDILFESADADIQEKSYGNLNKIIDILSKINNPVIIEGHTDSIPYNSTKYSSNWELSTARAASVINYLVKDNRINPKRLSAVGYGEYVPVAENTSDSGRMKNRRVDIIILNNNIGEQNGK